jgi:MFS family permease
VLTRLGVDDPGAELDRFARAEAIDGSQRLSWARHRRPILLAFAIAAFNQLSGINAILYYLNDIFAAAGFDTVSADRQAVAIGACNLAFTALALGVIDRFGRRTLLLVGAAGLTVALAGVAAVFIMGQHQDWLLWLLVGFIAFFAFSQGAVIWVYISEIFPTDVRARGQSLGASTHWFMDAIIAAAFPLVAQHWRGRPSWSLPPAWRCRAWLCSSSSRKPSGGHLRRWGRGCERRRGMPPAGKGPSPFAIPFGGGVFGLPR